MANKGVLITSAAGFLGSYLCDNFIARDFHVIGMDNLITGQIKNFEHLMPLPNFEIYHHDFSKNIHIPGSLDYILQFASPDSPIDYLNIPIQALKVCSLGTHNLIGLAKSKQARIMLASTFEVYGNPLVHPQTEDFWVNVNPIGPRGVNDESKLFQEAITMAYHRFHGVETRIVQIFNNYCTRMRLDEERVLPDFIEQLLRGELKTIFGDGSQTCSFCYVSNLVEGLYRPLPQDDPMQRQPNIDKAKEILKWIPKVSRKEGLKITLDFFKTLTEHELHKIDHKDFEQYNKF